MKVQVSFNQLAYETSINSLHLNINKLIKCLDNIEVITGNRSLQSLAEIEKFICDKTNFKNVKLSSELLNVSNEYNYLENNTSLKTKSINLFLLVSFAFNLLSNAFISACISTIISLELILL